MFKSGFSPLCPFPPWWWSWHQASPPSAGQRQRSTASSCLSPLRSPSSFGTSSSVPPGSSKSFDPSEERYVVSFLGFPFSCEMWLWMRPIPLKKRTFLSIDHFKVQLWPLQWIEESTVQLFSSTYHMFMVLYHLLSSAIWKCNDGYWWEHSLHSKPPTQGRCPRQQDFRKSLFNFFFMKSSL